MMFPNQNNMAAFIEIFIFCLGFKLNFAGFKLNFADPTATLVWPTEFHLNVERLDLKTGITETMEIWSSLKQNRSRIDFYGGTTKSYYVWPQNDLPFGYVFYVFPCSNEHEQNKKECQDTAIKSKNYKFLPNARKYVFAGEKMHEGSKVRVWEQKMNLEDLLGTQFTIYTQQPEPGYDVPVQMVQKVFYNARGMLMQHAVTNYFNFDADLDPEVFDAGRDDCKLLSKQGEDFHTDLKYLHHSIESHVNTAFHSFKNHHKKQYASQSEYELRKHIFAQNWAFINNHNMQNASYKLQVNRFADYTPKERAALRGTTPSNGPGTHTFPHSGEEVKVLAKKLPNNYDMRLEGVISVIKDQAFCGSCWAFAATAAVEGALARSNGGRVMDLSEQSMVDCAWGFSNHGCNSGNLLGAFQYIRKHGLPLEEEYGAYLAHDGYCHRDNMTATYGIRGFAKVTPRHRAALRVALNKYGPVAANINFNDAMMFYSTGVFYDAACNRGKINHSVNVVGYGRRNGSDYWIVRNSYGDDWGENGYMLLSAKGNHCFLLDTPFYSIV